MQRKLRVFHIGHALISFFAALSCLAVHAAGDTRLAAAALLPVFAHECGHLMALALLGFSIVSMRLGPSGLCICYDGFQSAGKNAAAALAGPLAGLVYALIARLLYRKTSVDWLLQSADLSLLLSFFNLLPILPLDGGRLFQTAAIFSLGEERGVAFTRKLSRVLLAGVLLLGLLLSVLKKGNAAIAAGLWLLLLQNEELPLVKSANLI